LETDNNRSGDQGPFPSTDPASPQSLQEIGILELIEQDNRPTFVIDIQPTKSPVPGGINTVFCNTSLHFFDDLRKALSADTFYPSPSRRRASLRVAVLKDIGRDDGFQKEARMGRYNIKVVIGHVVFLHFEPYPSGY
jgi:hypothetical protein